MSANYFKNRGDEYGKKLAVGMEAAQKDGYKFSAQTAIALGATPEHAADVAEDVIRNRGELNGLEHIIECDSDMVYGYCKAIADYERSRSNLEWDEYLSRPENRYGRR